MIRSSLMALAALGLTAACQTPLPPGTPPVGTGAEAPPGAPEGTCWGKEVTPAVIETVTEQVLVRPAVTGADGTVTTPAVYRTETRQAIVRERKETWFETPCADVLTPGFIASLQRALKARGLYRGAVTGVMDARTVTAVRLYQKPQGIDSGVLSLAAARKLGLIAVARDGG